MNARFPANFYQPHPHRGHVETWAPHFLGSFHFLCHCPCITYTASTQFHISPVAGVEAGLDYSETDVSWETFREMHPALSDWSELLLSSYQYHGPRFLVELWYRAPQIDFKIMLAMRGIVRSFSYLNIPQKDPMTIIEGPHHRLPQNSPILKAKCGSRNCKSLSILHKLSPQPLPRPYDISKTIALNLVPQTPNP